MREFAKEDDCGLLDALELLKEKAPGRFGEEAAAAEVDMELRLVWLADAMLPLALREWGAFCADAINSAKSL